MRFVVDVAPRLDYARARHEYSKNAQPFDWTFTRHDPHALLDHLDQRGRLTPAA